MSNLSLREIAQSQLDSTPVIDGQLIVCLDTGNAYRDTATAHVKIGSDLEVVSDLPLAPLAEKLYYLKPDKLYVFLGGNWTLLNDKTIDLDESIAKLPAGSSTVLNDDVEIITQDTDVTQPHYYRRKLVVLWEYIKTKAQDFFAAKNHQHGKADITDFPTSMPASDVYPWAKAATKPSYTKAEIGLGKVDNTADADKTVKRATTAGTADSANSVAWGNVRDKPTTFPVEAHNHDDRYYTEAEMDGKLEKKSPTDHTHDLSELISGLSIGNSTTLNDSVQIITQDTNTANQKYYRRPLTVLWDYIKSKADSVYSAIEHNHKIQNLEEYTTRVYDATIVRPADTVLASPQDKDGLATFRKLDKNDVGLENVDNTADKNKNVATAGIATMGVRDYNNANNTIKIGWQGADLDAKTLAYVAGYTSDKKIHPASKDGVRSWLGLGDSAYKNTKSRSNKGSTDWTNNATDDAIVPTMSFMAYWDGAYNSNGASNLSYCDHGRFGTIVTKNTGDYAVAEHIHLNGTKSGAVDWNTFTTYGIYKIQNCTMSDTYHTPNPEYQFGILQVLDSENNVGEKRILQIYWPHSTHNGNHFWYRMHNSSDINAGWSGWAPIKNKPDTSGVSDITNALSGFTPRYNQGWGVQAGTFIHGESDSTGGDFAFRRDCPNAGQVSMVLDGRFYQNEGQYRVLDESDISGIRTRTDTDVGVPLAKSSIDGSVPWSGAGINTDYANSKSIIGSSYDGGQWYNVLSIRHRNGASDGNNYGMLIYSNLTYLSDTLWYRKQSNGGWTENRNILDSTNYSSYALPKSGGTISGALNFANGTWNLVGDDAYMGDHNIGGSFCIMGANDTTRLALVNKDNQGDYALLEYGGGNLNFNKKLGANITGHADGDLALSGGTMSGQIIKSTGGSWIGDRDRAAIRSRYAGNRSYGAVAAMATKNGYWTMGNLGGNESLIFNYSPDSNYNAGKNETSQVYLPAQAGTIITSATIGNQTVNRAKYLGNDAAYMRMHWNGQGGQPTWLWGGNDASNMYVWNPSNFSVNYANSAGNGVTASGKTGAGIYYVRFGNGTQMCWGFYKESDHSGSTSFPVAFNNSQYSISLTATTSSNNASYITGRSTTSFSYARHGMSYNDVQWIAVGTWK